MNGEKTNGACAGYGRDILQSLGATPSDKTKIVMPAKPDKTEQEEIFSMKDDAKPGTAPTRLVSPNEAAEMTTLTAPQLALMSARGEFPQPVRISERRIAYVRAEIDEWIEARITGRTKD